MRMAANTDTDIWRVMIVDDHDMVRVGLKAYLMLEPKIEVVAEAASGLEALEKLKDMAPGERPQLVLMDLMMPEMDGVETTKHIMADYPSTKVVMLTSFLEDDKVVAAIEAGATSYVLKTVSAEELIYALHGAMNGMPVMNTNVSQALTRGLRERTAHEEEGLTAREREVLLMIAEGRSNKDIAAELYISIKTVKTHVSNLLMKCGLEDRTQLAVYAHRKGWAK
jgi:NarL family two-component system response regulator LiaR